MQLKEENIEELMNRAARKLYAQGEVTLPEGETITARHVFCFDACEVAEIHTYKKGTGYGIWFRLKDGRVFDKTGGVSEYDPDLYDTEQS